MSGRGRNAAPVVVREYRHSRNECVRALELLLKKSVSEMAAEPAPEPDSCITTQIDRGALVLKPQQMRPSPVNEGNLDTGGHPLDQY
jgi:hypothetical protein